MKYTTILPTLLAVGLWTPLMSVTAQEKKPDTAKIEGAATLERVAAISHWEPIFNGKDLTGWTGDTEKYEVKDGVLVCTKGAKVLETEKEYSDFVLHFKFKLTDGGNNGIGIRVPKGGHAAKDGMEIQVLDDRSDRYHKKTEDGKRVGTLKEWQNHGSIYGLYPAKTGYLKPLDEWNEQYIIVVEDHIKVVLNGAVIVDAYLEKLTPLDGRTDITGMHRRSGHIQLAGHDDHVEFKDLKIAEYAPSAPTPKTAGDNQAPEGFELLFNGKDLANWKGMADNDANKRRALQGDELKAAQEKADEQMRAHWTVVDGILNYDGQGASLATAKDYGDFELYVDWKIPPGADSGLYLRGTPQVQIWDPFNAVHKGEKVEETPEALLKHFRHGQNLGSGGLWNNRKHSNRPLVLADNPIGEWNTFLIRMVGEKVSIWLNGKQVVDRTVLENFWDRENNRVIPVPRADQIELQHHGDHLQFKNIYIREIPY